ncbi:methyl-accepting chemotaxis protein [Ostreibacterium oceani]|uniref:Twitching motility protein PilJ n=1 Tax=Ostreibacterium oceani TaxID=2654998 RepID=A0A6N7ETU5_9GAMM|nr:methyl-accepting chemotaxis protein [Ostreibacterium oceani]MPV85373.1 hypothetical protein [Ostreibacterium oceani]
MKSKNKVNKSNQGNNNKQGGSIRTLVFLLAVISLLASISLGWFYKKSLDTVEEAKQAVDEQISLSSGFSLGYLQAVKGNANQADQINRNSQKFGGILQRLQADELGLGIDAAQQSILTQVDKDWYTMRNYLDNVVNAKSAISVVHEVTPELSTLASEINLSATKIRNSLDQFQNIAKLSANLTALSSVVNNIDSQAQKVLLGGNEARDASVKIGENLGEFFAVINEVDQEVKRQGSIVFNTPKDLDEIDVLTAKTTAFQIALADLTSYMPQFIQVNSAANDIDSQATRLTSSLRELKETYTNQNVSPLSPLPLSYEYLIAITALLALAFFALWAWLQYKNGERLRKEADRLRKAEEEQNKKNQEAILRLMDELANLSDGDLTVEAQVTEDFTGAIADSVNYTVESMRGMVGTITHTSKQIDTATESTQGVSRLLEDSSKQQSQQISQVSEVSRLMSDSLNEIAKNTDSSVEIARSSVDFAQDGRNRVRSTIKSMNDIRENIQDTAKRIKRLGESSQEIGDIVEIIKGIADQTNVLALNAAIQATSAGEAGRGFAVVADEVQRLAERSANATKRIEVLVKTIQADANEAVASMESSTKQVVTGTSVAEEAGQSLDKIENVSQNLANLIVNVSKATRNAAGMSAGVAQSMDVLTSLNSKTRDDVKSAVKSVDNLLELSSSLRDSVSGFKLPN